jgi:exonuclease III
MKILNWNIERFKPIKRQAVLDEIMRHDADIVILTEASIELELAGFAKHTSKSLPSILDGQQYQPDEVRTSIYTRYSIIKKYSAYNNYTCICVDIETPKGVLTIYAGVIGVLGAIGDVRHIFEQNLVETITDLDTILPTKQNICFAGDFNITMGKYRWPTIAAHNAINDVCAKFKLQVLTKEPEYNVCHICISQHLLADRIAKPILFNENKQLSDHVGIVVAI